MKATLSLLVGAGLTLGGGSAAEGFAADPAAVAAAPSPAATLASACRQMGPPGVAPAPAPFAPAAEPPAYYAIDLVTTKNIPGTARATGTGHPTFAVSPFGVALAPDGSFLYDLGIRLAGMEPPASGVLVAWVTTPQVDRIVRLGAFDGSLSARGQVAWNKFLVVVTLEERDDPGAATWSGPIVLRGMSRSGMMHTMAGHGPFQKELCAKYGY